MKLINKKTGEIIDLEVGRITDSGYGSAILLSPVAAINESYTYSSLAELNEEWEDAEDINVLSEPLIKDEKVRKAVRAWAEALNADEVRYNSCAEYSEGRFEAEMGMADIDFGRVIGLKDGNYTIAELCGEGEE